MGHLGTEAMEDPQRGGELEPCCGGSGPPERVQLTTINPSEMILDRLSDKAFALEWLKMHDADLERLRIENAKLKREIARLESINRSLTEGIDEEIRTMREHQWREANRNAWGRA